MFIRTPILAALVYLVSSACRPGERAGSPVAFPSEEISVVGSRLGIVDGYIRGDTWGEAATAQALTEQQEIAVKQALEGLPDFPDNAFNGCQARAHAVYNAIKLASGGKAYKVWLLGADVLSAVLKGHISYNGFGVEATTWNYHVAAAFATKSHGIQVVDGLVSKRPLPLENWVNRFRQVGVVVLTYTDGSRYLYNTYEVPLFDKDKSVREVLNRFFEYSGISAEAHEGAKAIAADALTVAFRAGRLSSCVAFKPLAIGNHAIDLSNMVSPFLPMPSFLELAKFQQE